MKKQFYTLAFLTLPTAAFAQPTLNKAEDFTAGTTVKRLNCSAVAAGTAGASQTWNFASLVPTDTTTLTYMSASAGSAFPAATLVEKSTDSTYRFFNKTATATYVIGIAYSSSSSDKAKITYANPMLAIQRPLAYNAAATDSFEHTITSSNPFTLMGKGEIKIKADGYGTLILPNGTYNNVLRVRMESNQKDSIGAPIEASFNTTIVSYAWYDNAHKAPLLRIDSMDAAGTPDVSVSYLHKENYPVSITSIATKKIEFYAFFNGRQLNVTGSFEKGKAYSLSVYDLAGRAIHNETFTASGTEKNCILQTDAPAGIYMVSVLQDDAQAAGYIKLAKDH